MGIVFDTSVLVEMERRDAPLGDGLRAHLAEPLVIPVIVWAELLVGVRMAGAPDRIARRRARLEQLRLHVPLVAFDADIAEHYADIFSESLRAGRRIPQNDMAVAATARKLGYAVLVSSRDEAHFRAVEGLRVLVLPAA